MKYELKDGYISAKSKGKLQGVVINFPNISVGATENLIIASVLAKDKTTLKNCAIEPEIKDLTNFLISAGANIKWNGRTCTIKGVNSLKEIEYSVMADRIEAGTFCVAATVAKGNLEINNLDPKIINTELKLLKKSGAIIKTTKNKILIKGPKKIKPLNAKKTVGGCSLESHHLYGCFMTVLSAAIFEWELQDSPTLHEANRVELAKHGITTDPLVSMDKPVTKMSEPSTVGTNSTKLPVNLSLIEKYKAAKDSSGTAP